jgi:hypothetical protein
MSFMLGHRHLYNTLYNYFVRRAAKIKNNEPGDGQEGEYKGDDDNSHDKGDHNDHEPPRKRQTATASLSRMTFMWRLVSLAPQLRPITAPWKTLSASCSASRSSSLSSFFSLRPKIIASPEYYIFEHRAAFTAPIVHYYHRNVQDWGVMESHGTFPSNTPLLLAFTDISGNTPLTRWSKLQAVKELDEDAEAALVWCRLLHARTKDIPKKPTAWFLKELTTFAFKYDCIEILEYAGKVWLGALHD